VETLRPVTIGSGFVNAKWSAADSAEFPAPDWRITSTVPAASAGEIAVMDVGLVTVKLVAATEPNRTPVIPVRFVPVMMTDVAPLDGPLVTERPLTAGEADWNVYLSAEVNPDVPAVFVTVTSTVPGIPMGTTAVIEVLEFITYDAAGVVPNATPMTFVKFVPTSVILVPPAAGPDEAERPVTAGGNTGVVNVS
jgi:hypothetical protein